jgi:hypothetical protein
VPHASSPHVPPTITCSHEPQIKIMAINALHASTGSLPHPTHIMQTQFKSHSHKPRAFTYGTIPYPPPKALLAMTDAQSKEPTSFIVANKAEPWRATMNSKFNTLMQNGIWTLVPCKPHMNLVGCK